jgi:hypothetical protein
MNEYLKAEIWALRERRHVEEVVSGARPRFLTDRGSNRRQALPLRQPIHADMAGGAELGATLQRLSDPLPCARVAGVGRRKQPAGPGLCTFTSFGPSLMGLRSFPCIEYCSMFLFCETILQHVNVQ